VKRNLLELQHSEQTLAQLNTLIREPEMVCTILAISPHCGRDKLAYAANFNALIVHDQDWYLLRSVPIKLIHHLLPLIDDIHRIFFIAEPIQDLAPVSLEVAADYLVSLQPCLLCEASHDRLYALAAPYQGFLDHPSRTAVRTHTAQGN
jgi:hypothetical protein